MPPKKDAKKEAVQRPDNSGISKNDIDFKFEFAVKMAPQSPSFAIMYEWFSTTSEKTERYDTGFIDTWPKNPNNAEQLLHERIFDPIRVDDDFCKKLCTAKFYVYIVDEDMKVKQEVYLDLSSLLMGTTGPQTVLDFVNQFAYTNDKILILEIELLRITISSNKQLLTDVYRQYLNPFQIEVIGAKDIPDSSGKDYLPTYVKYSFFDGTEVETQGLVSQRRLVWAHKHVFLAGLIEPTLLKQKLRSNYLRFQLHDRDELKRNAIKEDVQLIDITKMIAEEMEKDKPVEEDPKKKGGKKEAKKETKQPEKKDTKKQVKKDPKKKDAKLGEPIRENKKIEVVNTSYGVVAFFLVDFLQANVKHFKLRGPVVPRNAFQDFQSRNIDLNTTARTEMQRVLASNNYFQNDTTLVVGFTLSCPIGSFVKPQRPASAAQPVADDPKRKKQAKDPKKEAAVAVQLAPPTETQLSKPPQRKDVYERVIYLMPYKSPDLVQTIQDFFYSTNLKAMNLQQDRIKELTTIVLKSEQKTDTKLDILTGIQILDNDFRLFIIEGLREGAIAQLGLKIEKLTPNTKQNKIIKNTNIGFLERLYVEFNLDLKRIRLRPNLTELLLQPSIYIKSKVAEEICTTLNHINDIRKLADNLKTVQTMNWWPQAKWLIQIERKFSDSVSYQDIHGIQEMKKTKRVKEVQPMSQTSPSTKKEETSLPRIQNKSSNLVHTRSNTLNHKTYSKTGFNKTDNYNLQLKHAEIPANQQVYMYAGQANNWYEQQMRQMREQLRNDKNKMYSYGHGHMSLSVDPYSLQEKKKVEAVLDRTPVEGKPPFSSLIVKTKDQRMRLPKRPDDQTIEDMKKYAYHEDKMYQKEMLKNTRGMPADNGKTPYVVNVGKIEYFSQPEVVAGQKISPVEKEKQEKQQKKRYEEEERKKMKGDAYIYIKKQYPSGNPQQMDKYKGILQGSPVKKGLLLPKKTIQQAKVSMARQIGDLPVSAFIHDDFDKSKNPLVRVDRPDQSTVPQEFHNFQNPQFLTKSSVHRPLKKTNFQ